MTTMFGGHSQEMADFEDSVARLMTDRFPREKAHEWEAQEGVYPVALWDALAAGGFHGLGIPPEWGGSGAGITAQTIFVRHLARAVGGLSWTWATTAFAGARPIAQYGTTQQKEDLLPRIAEGRCRIAIGATEPDGGTDVLGALRTRARRDGDEWVLDGAKTWSTGAADSDLIVVLARTSTATERPADGCTMFLVPMDADGLSVRKIPKLGMRSISSCEVSFDAVRLPADSVLGELDDGFRSIVGALNFERIVVSAISLGLLDAVIEDASQYALEREAFGRPIGGFQLLQGYLADMRIDQLAAEALTFRAADAAEASLGKEISALALAAKVFTSEAAVRAADRGIQILGGMGYSQEMHMQRLWRDARLYPIAPITNEVARCQIAESMGMPRSY